MGKRTSVYLSDDLSAAVKASGVSLAELVTRGLAASGPQQVEIIPLAPKAVISRSGRSSPGTDCPHPKARIAKGLCNACGTYVGKT